MVLAPSLPIQCKQIHEAPSVLSPVQIKSTGMRRRAGEGGVHCHWHRVHNYSTALYLPLNPFCNKKKKKMFASCWIWGAYEAVFDMSL